MACQELSLSASVLGGSPGLHTGQAGWGTRKFLEMKASTLLVGMIAGIFKFRAGRCVTWLVLLRSPLPVLPVLSVPGGGQRELRRD